jgi:hypothetical protein
MKLLAERELKFKTLEGKRAKKVMVRLGQPEPVDDGENWFLPYEIQGPSRNALIQMRVGGVDAIQALVLGLAHVSARLEALASAEGGKLTFLGEDDLGFHSPMRSSTRASSRKRQPSKG